MASPNDLTTLADCKLWLGVASATDDGLIAALISAVSQAILADLGRPGILPSTWTETLDGNGGGVLALRHWPITRLLGCAINDVALTGAVGEGRLVVEAPDCAPPGTMQVLVFRGGAFPRGAQNVTVTYRAGYEVTGEPAMVPTTPPYAVTALAPYGAWRTDTGVTGAVAPYTAAAGAYTFTSTDAGAAVTLSYGYIPADLARAACEWVADRYASRTRIGQSAKTLGGQETTSFIVKAMPDVVDRLLRPYRRVAR